MRDSQHPGRPAVALSAFALLLGLSGCEEKHTPPGTNAAAGEVTTEGPGSTVAAKAESRPEQTTPNSGGGSGMAPPVSPAKDSAASGESNSGQQTGKNAGVGSDATTEGAKPANSDAVPSNGSPPRPR